MQNTNLYSLVCRLAFVFGVAMLIAGCNKKDVDALVSQAKQQIDDTSSSVKDVASKTVDQASASVGLAGKVSLFLDAPVDINACYATFVELAPDRSNVLKLQSYKDANAESLPSTLIQAAVGELARTELSGKTLSAQVFVQATSNGPVWYSKSGEPVELVISKQDEKHLAGKFGKGKLYNSQTGAAIDITGEWVGLFE